MQFQNVINKKKQTLFYEFIRVFCLFYQNLCGKTLVIETVQDTQG